MKIVVDLSIPCTDQEAEVDVVEVHEIVSSPSTFNRKDESTDESDDDSNMEDAFDEESIHLFVDLARMDLMTATIRSAVKVSICFKSNDVYSGPENKPRSSRDSRNPAV